jgi:hypothetical protein
MNQLNGEDYFIVLLQNEVRESEKGHFSAHSKSMNDVCHHHYQRN